MRLIDIFRLRLRSLFSRQKVEQELEEELRYHLERQIEEGLAAGMTRAEARSAALRSIQGVEQRKEECRDMRGLAVVENLAQDFRYGWRQLRKTPVFTLTALLSLNLGIGASVTMFSAFRAVFLRSLPYRDADRLVEIEKTAQHGYTPALTAADLEFLRRYAHSFQSAASFGFFKSMTLSRVSEPADLWVREVSAELFPLLGAKPLLGRTLVPSDFRPHAQQAVVLSYDAWNKYFHRDPGILRHPIFLNEESYLVVGVMPREFSFPKAGTAVWLPARTPIVDPMHMYVSIVARLRKGVSLHQARTELNQLAPALLRRYPPSERNWKLALEDVATRDVEGYRTAFLLLMGAAGFLVLISCLNVANLLLARASAREGEFTMRSALGARRSRLIGQVLTESLLLAGLGGVLGVCLAYCGNRLLWLLPTYREIPRLEETHLDLAVLGFAVLLTFLVALLFGLAPALALSANKLTRPDRQSRSTTANSWHHSALLIGEIAISLILLAGSVLMLRGFVRLSNVDPGFRTAHILTATVPPGHAARLTREQLTQRYSEILRMAQNIPGVEQAALTSYLPLGKVHVQLRLYLPGVSPNPYQIDFHAVSADYFAVMGIPLLQGRLFSKFDPAMDKGAVVINRAMAHKYWPGQDAIGQRMGGRPPSPPDLTVVGVVGNTQPRSLSWDPIPEFYEPYQQYLGPAVGATLVLRTFGDPNAAASSLRKALHRFDPEQVVENERTMKTIVEQSIATPRFYTVLLGTFALMALVLTLIGVYGVASYGTSLRRREFAIRMALGAERHKLIGMILRQGLFRALLGVCAGGCGAWALAHLMSSLVYGIPVRDPVSLGIAIAVLLAGALLAYYLPASRSTKIDPAQVLRQE